MLNFDLVRTPGSTQITIAVKEGGKKLLTVQDNGHGIEVMAPNLLTAHMTRQLIDWHC